MTTKKQKATSTALAVRQQRLARVKPPAKKKPASKTASRPAGPKPEDDQVKLELAKPLEPGAMLRTLEEDLDIGLFGTVEIKFTPEEEAILSEPVNLEDVRVLPSGAVYLPHIVYTRWLNRAIGRGRWALKPLSKPALSNGQVIVPYHLMIHGHPAAGAYGEQDYHERNRQQTYGDALEATQASALRRMCKRLGIGLELWDREFADHFLADRAVEVPVEVNKKQDDGTWKTKTEYQWRLRTSPPLKGEKRRQRDDDGRGDFIEHERQPAQPVRQAASHAHDNEPITDAQLMRLHTIARKRGRTDEEMKLYVRYLGLTSSREIRRKDYDTVCTAIEHPGDLPRPAGTFGREPGMEG